MNYYPQTVNRDKAILVGIESSFGKQPPSPKLNFGGRLYNYVEVKLSLKRLEPLVGCLNKVGFTSPIRNTVFSNLVLAHRFSSWRTSIRGLFREFLMIDQQFHSKRIRKNN